MADPFTGYETGMNRLLEWLGSGHPRYAEALTLQARLTENIAQTRRYGDNETHRTERAQVVDSLNCLALGAAGVSFNELSGQEVEVGQGTTTLPEEFTRLRENLVQYFDREELRTLCADLGVDYDGLRGEGKEGKARELVAYLDRRKSISVLIKICIKLRPQVDWEQIAHVSRSEQSRREDYRIAGHMFRAWFEANKAGRSDADIGEEARVSQGSERGQKEFRYDVFISYSHQDTAWVRDTLLPTLERGGLCVCIDCRDFEIGVPILTNIERAVDNSRHTLLVLTPAWVESEWTEFESLLTGTADPAGRRRKLMPLMLKSCELPGRISMLHCADFTQPQDQEEQFSRLISQLQRTAATARPSAEELPPFIAGPPVTHPRHFFGRERELKRLFNLWKHPPLQNAAIVGPRRSGKTSLLLYLKSITTTPQEQLRPGQRADWLPQPERYRWIFVDFQDPRVGSREGLLHYLLTSLDLPVPRPCDLERCMDVMSHGLRTPTVILLDEIGVALQRYSELDDVFWEGLRALATSQAGGNLGFVLAAHERPDQLAHHGDLSSPFFNIFGYTATLGLLKEPEARELIASSPIQFPPTDTDWILAQSGRWPLLLQILCRERLVILEEGEIGDAWQEDGLCQIAPFQYLLGVQYPHRSLASGEPNNVFRPFEQEVPK